MNLENITDFNDFITYMKSGSKLKLLLPVLFGIIIIFAIASFSDISQTIKALNSISPIYSSLAFVSLFIAAIIKSYRWKLIYRASGCILSIPLLFKSLTFGYFINFLLPARIGDASRALSIKFSNKTSLGLSFTTIAIERIMDVFSLAILVLITTLFSSEILKLKGLLIIAFGLVSFMSLDLFILYRYDSFILRIFGKKFKFIVGFIASMKEAIYKTKDNPKTLIASLFLSSPIWLFEILSIFLAAKAINYDIPLEVAIVAGTVAFLSQSIPITPAGIGIFEGAMSGALAMMGVPLYMGLAISLIDHSIRILFIIIFGAYSSYSFIKQKAS